MLQGLQKFIFDSSLDYYEIFLRCIIALFGFTFFALSIYAPTIQHFKGYPSGENVYSFLSNFCHQYPLRSFWIFERPFGLCARCSSGYFGLFFCSSFIFVNKKYLKRILIGIILLLLTIVDPVLQLFNFYESTNTLRFITGFLGGISVFLIINPFNKLNNKEAK